MGKYHKIVQGECLATIALENGFSNYHAIYDHPKNAALKAKYGNPDILFPGDLLFIPDKGEKQESRGTGAQHSFQVPTRTVKLRLFLKDDAERPLAGKNCELRIGALTLPGTTDGAGLLELEVPTSAREAQLRLIFGEGDTSSVCTWNLAIGHLDPVYTVSGAQGRLLNLGFDTGAIDSIMGPRTEGALSAFQSKAGIPVTGRLDGPTRAKLVEIHDEDGSFDS